MDEFSDEQLIAVKRINKCTNYYDILNVDEEASDSTIKKSYKKLALLLHPDKNKAPGAIDAFKKLGTAAAVLTDQNKRNEYDLYGSNTNVDSTEGWFAGSPNNDLNFSFRSADISPEDFLNLFFNDLNNFANFNQSRVYNTRQPHYADSDDDQDDIPNQHSENHTIDERSLFRKILDVVFIFVITWIVNLLLRPRRR